MALFALFAFAFTAQSASAAVVNNPGAFTGSITGGLIKIKDLEVGLEGMDPSPTVAGTIDSDGNILISSPQTNVVFPPVQFDSGSGILDVKIQATGTSSGWTGTLNPSTGTMNLNASLRVKLEGNPGISLGSNCYVGGSSADAQVLTGSNVKLTPATSGTIPANAPAPSLTGIPYKQSLGRSTMVNNTGAVAGASNCAILGLANGAINDALGLPSASGNNQITLEVELVPTGGGTFTGDVVPKFTVDPPAGKTPFEVEFDASSSQSLAADIQLCDEEITEDCGYQWDWNGDGTVDEVVNTAITEHTYSTVGVFNPELTICDENGLCSTDSGPSVTANSLNLEFTSQPPALSNQTTATFGFTSDEPEATFECSLDNGEWAACESPASFSGLSDGSHQLRIRGILDEEPSLPLASNTFEVETAAPVVTFGGGSPSNTNSATSGTVSWTATDANPPVTFECSYDGAEFAACESGVEVEWPAELGQHTFAVRATDSLGNTGTATREWGFDNRPIVATWLSEPLPPYVNNTPNIATRFDWAFDREGVTSECRKNTGGFTACTPGQTGSGSFTNNATNTFEVRATDSYGNVSNVLSQSFYYDTSAPGASTFSSPANNSSVTTNTVTLAFSLPTGGSPISQECSIDSTSAYVPCSSPWTTPVLPSKGSAYVFRVRNRDAAGNVQTATVPTRNVTVNAPPLMEITGGPEEGSTSDSRNAEFSFTADRVSGSTFSCKLDDGEYEPCSSPVNFVDLANGEHTFSVRGTRDVGTGAPAERTWTVDAVDPFEVTFDHSLVSFGQWSNIPGVPEGEEISLEGEFTDDEGNFVVPADGVSFPTIEFNLGGGLPMGTVDFEAAQAMTGNFAESNGRLLINSRITATVQVGNIDEGITCYMTRNMTFNTNLGSGVRFTQGLDGPGAVATSWTDLPTLTGDEGCDTLQPFVAGPGSIWMGSEIEAPPGAPVVITPPSLSGSGNVNTNLTCTPGEFDGVTQGVILRWTRDGVPFENLNGQGNTARFYSVTAGDVGSSIACEQVATNGRGSTTATSNSIEASPRLGPSLITAPELSGSGLVNGVLTCTPGTWEGVTNGIALEWTRDGEVFTNLNAQGKPSKTYRAQAGDVGSEIACQQTAYNKFASTTASSAPITITELP